MINLKTPLLMTRFPALFLMALTASPLAAQSAPEGCFARDYSAAHLAAQPDQVVDCITVNFAPSDHDDTQTIAVIRVLMANQGHAARNGIGGMILGEAATNWADPLTFGIDCDGGTLEVTRQDGDMIEFRTQYLRVSTEGCSGDSVAGDLAEHHGEWTTYRLFSADPSFCEAS